MKKLLLFIVTVTVLSSLTSCVKKKTFDIYADDGNETVATETAGTTAEDDGETAEEIKETEMTTAEEPLVLGESVEGITVISGTFGKPESGKMAYTPSGASGYFAVDGTLVAQTTIGIAVDPNGILNFDLALSLDEAKEVKAEIVVYKDGDFLTSYMEEGLPLPAGETQINACVNTDESTPCEGTYQVLFLINDVAVYEGEGTL